MHTMPLGNFATRILRDATTPLESWWVDIPREQWGEKIEQEAHRLYYSPGSAIVSGLHVEFTQMSAAQRRRA